MFFYYTTYYNINMETDRLNSIENTRYIENDINYKNILQNIGCALLITSVIISFVVYFMEMIIISIEWSTLNCDSIATTTFIFSILMVFLMLLVIIEFLRSKYEKKYDDGPINGPTYRALLYTGIYLFIHLANFFMGIKELADGEICSDIMRSIYIVNVAMFTIFMLFPLTIIMFGVIIMFLVAICL